MMFENVKMSNKKRLLFILIFFAVMSILYCLQPPDAEELARDRFVKDLDLLLTLKVKEIIPTNNGRYYVLIGDVIHSNKKIDYKIKFQTNSNDYDYCIVNGTKGFIVFHCMEPKNHEEVRLDDSLIINSNQNKYWLYRHGNLLESYNLNVGTEGDFSRHLTYDLTNSNYLKK